MDSKDFSLFLKHYSTQPIQVLDTTIPSTAYIAIHISSINPDLKTFDINSSGDWENYIYAYLQKNNKSVAYGGYLEQRDIYKRSKTFNQDQPDTARNIHLGIDLWTDAGAKVLAAFDGEIHSFKNNTNWGDYGPTIILKHQIDSIEFFTLYGHLSLESLKHLEVGKTIKQGEIIGYLGTALVNGDYAPHLHFQLIKDIQNNKGDYPGVASVSDIEFYKENCPDPNLVLKLS